MRRLAVAGAIAILPLVVLDARVDRALVWTTASDASLERELKTYAARGFRVAAVSDGLPCTVTVLQVPESPAPPAEYALVADRDLDTALRTLPGQGFVPRFTHRRAGVGRAHVIFERSSTSGRAGAAAGPPATWRSIEFADLDALPGALEAASGEGFQPRLLVRYPLKSWPGLSERGLVLGVRDDRGGAREAQVVIGQSSRIDAAAKAVAAAGESGFSIDLLFTGSRDGSVTARRERLVVVLSRAAGAAPAPRPVTLERTTAFGTFGGGVPLGAAPFWDDSYVYAFSPVPRRQIWASPIRLSSNEASCLGLPFKLRIDAPHDLSWSIVGLAARKLPNGAYELVYITDQRL